MDGEFEKVGVINYKNSKSANAAMLGGFLIIAVVGGLCIALSGSFEESALGWPWIVALCFGYILMHEAVHMLFMRVFSKERLIISVKFPTVSVGCMARFSRAQFVTVAIAPVAILGAALVLLLLVCGKQYSLALQVLLTLNFAGSVGDFRHAFEAYRYSAEACFQDNSVETSVYMRKREK